MNEQFEYYTIQQYLEKNKKEGRWRKRARERRRKERLRDEQGKGGMTKELEGVGGKGRR